MAEEYPDFSIYDKVLEPETKAGPSKHFSRTQAEGQEKQYKAQRFKEDGSEEDEWFNPIIKTLGLNEKWLLQNLQFMLVGVVGTIVGLPALGIHTLPKTSLFSGKDG